MSWKEVLKPSIAEFGPAMDTHQAQQQCPTSILASTSDGSENIISTQTSSDGMFEAGDKLYYGLELSCLPSSSVAGSTFELVCVDEWLKTRTESLSSMDLDVAAMKSDGIDPNYLTDSGVIKENPNLSELEQYLTPKGAVDLCGGVGDVSGSHQGKSAARLVAELGESEVAGLLLPDDLLLKEGKKPLFMMDSLDDGTGKDKDEDGLVVRRESWADSLELGKDKVNWESMSNVSHRSHELEKEVDFPEFNLVHSFDALCPIECSLPVGKELEEAASLDKEVDAELPVIRTVEHSTAEEVTLPDGDPVMSSIHDHLDALTVPLTMPSPVPIEIIAAGVSNDISMEAPFPITTTPTTITPVLRNPLPKIIKAEARNDPNKNVAVIISTNRIENTTQIVIRTPKGNQPVFDGKTRELVHATALLDKATQAGLKSDASVNMSSIMPSLSKIEKKSTFGGNRQEAVSKGLRDANANNGEHLSMESGDDSGSEETSEDQLAVDLNGERLDSSGEGEEEPEDEQPLIEALAAIGIKVDTLLSLTSASGNKMWMCPEKECGRTFTKQGMLKVHILAHYGLRPYKCDYEGCYWAFYTYFKLKRHKATHLKKKDFLCTVEGCGRRFTTIYNLNTHSKLHERPAEMICTVPGCNASFQTRRRLENHLKEHDVSHAPYRCSYCDKPYYSNNSLNAHVRSHEHKDEEVRCSWPDCGKLFDKPCRLKAHMRSHTGDRPYACNFPGCTWSFSSASKLTRHNQKHTDERKFKCIFPGCTKAFLRSEHLREHQVTHQGSRFHCTVEGCNTKFTAKSSLYVHMKKHQSGPIEKPMYSCPVEQCDRKYVCRSSVRHHVMKTHSLGLGDACNNSDQLIAFVTADDENDILLDGSALVAGDSGVTLGHEPSVVLSTINPADIMLSNNVMQPSVDTPIILSSGVLSIPDTPIDDGMGCARTNLPLPLVPRRNTGSSSVLNTPPVTLLSDDLFSDSLLASTHNVGIEYQIMMDEADTRQRVFPESTINLRDLE